MLEEKHAVQQKRERRGKKITEHCCRIHVINTPRIIRTPVLYTLDKLNPMSFFFFFTLKTKCLPNTSTAQHWHWHSYVWSLFNSFATIFKWTLKHSHKHTKYSLKTQTEAHCSNGWSRRKKGQIDIFNPLMLFFLFESMSFCVSERANEPNDSSLHKMHIHCFVSVCIVTLKCTHCNL